VLAHRLRFDRPEPQKEDHMNSDISPVSVVIVSVVYALCVFALLVYLAHSLAMGMMQARWVVEGMEMVF
jgi:hypothetical protein